MLLYNSQFFKALQVPKGSVSEKFWRYECAIGTGTIFIVVIVSFAGNIIDT